MQHESKWLKSTSSRSDHHRKSTFQKNSLPLKPRIDDIVGKIELEIYRFENIINNFKTTDALALRKLSTYTKERNTQCYVTLLSELIETRKVTKLVLLSKIVFQKLKIDLMARSDFNDLATLLAPATSALRNIRSLLIPYLPELEGGLGCISEKLGAILLDAGQVGGITLNFETANKNAARLIEDSSLIAQKKMKEEFADLPAHFILYQSYI